MSSEFTPADFAGTARLFPLPNLVLFPQGVQPLHIFEPRYRQMTADALADDRLLALVLLKPGWEEDYHARPAIHSTACLGKIVRDQCLHDGRYNLLLHGLSRVRLVEELPGPKLYRSARVLLVSDEGELSAPLDHLARRRLKQLLPAWVNGQQQILEHLHQLLQDTRSLGGLCDLLSFVLP